MKMLAAIRGMDFRPSQCRKAWSLGGPRAGSFTNWADAGIRTGLAILFLMQTWSAHAQPGTLDPDFSPGAGVDQSVFAMVAQTDGKIIIGGDFTSVAGVSRNGIARLNTDGALDSTFEPGSGADDLVNALVLQSDKVVIAGYFTQVYGTNQGYFARLDGNGRLDGSFDSGTGADRPVLALAVQSDGKLLLGGEFTSINGASRNQIARLNADGSVDTDFNPGTGVGDVTLSSVRTLALQEDGKVVIGGVFANVNGVARNNLARLNSNGSLDSSFKPNVDLTGAGVLAGVYAVAVQRGGKILVAGDFTRINGIARTNIARLNVDGSLDEAFDPGSGPDFAVNSVLVQSNGKILIGGIFTQVSGTTRNYLARLNSNGELDGGFDPGLGADGTIYAAALQPDGKLLIGGSFTSFAGVPRQGIARLFGDAIVSAPLLVNPIHTDGVFRVSSATVNGGNYFLEFKDSLSDESWTALPAVAGDGTLRTLVDPSAAGARRIYRVRAE
jgi:uncharacterized delta-60 repeat protein